MFACSAVEGKGEIGPCISLLWGPSLIATHDFRNGVFWQKHCLWSIRFVVYLFNLPVMTEYLDDGGPVPVRVNPATQTL